MKQYFILINCVLVWGVAPCQYTWFNQLYPSFDVLSFVNRIDVRTDTISTIGHGLWYDTDNQLRHGLVVKNVILENGSLYFEQNTASSEVVNGLSSTNYIQLPDNSWLNHYSYANEYECYSHVVLHVDSNLNYISETVLEGFEDCQPFGSNQYWPDGIFLLNDSEYVITQRVDFGNFDDSTGHYFTRMALDGGMLEQTLQIVGGAGTSRGYGNILRLGSDSLLIWGNAVNNYVGMGAFLQKTDLHGNVGQEVLLGSSGLSLSEEAGVGLIEPNGDLIMFRSKCYYVNTNIGQFKMQPRCQRFNTASLMEEEDDNILDVLNIEEDSVHEFRSVDICKAQGGGYLGLYNLGIMGETHAMLVKVDENLDLEWHRFYYPPNSPWNTHAFLVDIEPTPDGGYVMGGNTDANGQPHWIIKIDNCGYEVEMDCPEFVGVEEHATIVAMQLYPNPASDYVNVDLDGISNVRLSTLNIQVFDIAGVKVLGQQVKNVTQMQWDVSSLATGMYIVEVDFGAGQKTMQKLMVE